MQALPVLGIALQAAGPIVQGIAGYRAGKYNAKVAKLNARNTQAEGMEQATRIRAAGRVAMGRQIAAQGESGFEIGAGSALDSLMESATNSELEAMDAFRAARAKAAGYRAQGGLARMEGNNALVGGFFGAASAVVSGISDYASAKGDG